MVGAGRRGERRLLLVDRRDQQPVHAERLHSRLIQRIEARLPACEDVRAVDDAGGRIGAGRIGAGQVGVRLTGARLRGRGGQEFRRRHGPRKGTSLWPAMTLRRAACPCPATPLWRPPPACRPPCRASPAPSRPMRRSPPGRKRPPQPGANGVDRRRRHGVGRRRGRGDLAVSGDLRRGRARRAVAVRRRQDLPGARQHARQRRQAYQRDGDGDRNRAPRGWRRGHCCDAWLLGVHSCKRGNAGVSGAAKGGARRRQRPRHDHVNQP